MSTKTDKQKIKQLSPCPLVPFKHNFCRSKRRIKNGSHAISSLACLQVPSPIIELQYVHLFLHLGLSRASFRVGGALSCCRKGPDGGACPDMLCLGEMDGIRLWLGEGGEAPSPASSQQVSGPRDWSRDACLHICSFAHLFAFGSILTR